MSVPSAQSFSSFELYNKLLTLGDYDGFLRVLKQRKVQELENETDEIISAFFTHLNLKIKHRIVKLFEECLKYLADNCNPRNLLIIFTEKISKAEKLQDVVYFSFLNPIFTCLDRIDFPKTRALSLALNELYKRIYYLDLPKDLNLEDKERKLMLFDKETETITKWIVAVQNKINQFVEKNFNNSENIKKYNKEVKEVLKFEFRLLSKPLAYLDLSSDHKSVPSESRKDVEMVMKVLNSLQPNPVKMIDQCTKENETNDLNRRKSPKEINVEDVEIFGEKLYPVIGISVYAYLVFGEGLKGSGIPMVYSNIFLFLMNIPFISLMLSNTESSLLTHKGLKLGVQLMRRMTPGLLEQDQLESRSLHEILKCLSFVVSSSKVEDFKQTSLQLIATIVKAFQFEARPRLFYLLLSRFSNPGVIGGFIILLKNEIIECYEKEGMLEVLEVDRLFQLIFSLPKGEKSDLLECSELVVGALNLLNFLVTFDAPSKNKTKIWTVLPGIQNNFIHVLGRAIELSRCHYGLEMNKIRERSRVPEDGAGDQQQQIYCFHKAIQTFDMMTNMLRTMTSVIQAEKTKDRVE